MATTVSRTFVTSERLNLAARATLLLLVLSCEKLLLGLLVDYNAVSVATGLGAFIRTVQHIGFHFAVSCTVALAVLSFARRDEMGWAALNDAGRGARLRLSWFGIHFVALLALMPLTYFLYGRSDSPLPLWATAVLWVLLGAVAVLSLFNALAPSRIWLQAIRKPGVMWIYAIFASAVAVGLMDVSQRLWESMATITFDAVWYVLTPLIPSLRADPRTLILYSDHFAVRIEEFCSGLEGAGLLFAFCSGWLLCFRREYRFPQAFLLLPAALALSFALNVLRISLLMLMGYLGFPDAAIYGFHSQAGWIAFNCAAAFLAISSRRIRWLSRRAEAGHNAHQIQFASSDAVASVPSELPGSLAVGPHRASGGGTVLQEPHEGSTAAYLLPLLAMLAGGMLARTVSDGFERFYVLSAVGGVVALWWCWPKLRPLDWHWSWRAPLVGVSIFMVWAAAGRIFTHSAGMPATLSSMSPLWRLSWIGIRAAAAITVVPMAEELAFRGYLMRRLVTRHFESVRYHDVGATALIASSVIFGIEKAPLWLPGVLAGLMYAALLKHRGSLGEVVVAHGTANALLTVYVLVSGNWQLW